MPMISSQPMRVRYFPADAAHSPNFLSDTLKQLQQHPPRYIFMEKVFLQRTVPASYNESNANVMALLKFIWEHYQPQEQMQYLVAMKNKGAL